MNRIQSRVRAARRRLMLAALGRSLCTALPVGLMVAAIAIALPALVVMQVDPQTWKTSWAIGGAVAAVLVSLIATWITAPRLPAVALEVDRRFGLRERLSSAWSLSPQDRDSRFGQALLEDAEQRASHIKIADQFPLRPRRSAWLPLAAAILVTAAWLGLPEAVPETPAAAQTVAPEVAAQIKRASLDLKKRLAQQKRNAEAKGLEEARELFSKLERELGQIQNKKDVDRKQAMITLNDLKQQLEKRRNELGSKTRLRQAMSQLKSLEEGPAKEATRAIAEGDFEKAEQILRKLSEQWDQGELDESQRTELGEQLQQASEQLQRAVAQQREREANLERELEHARREGRMDDAAELQQQLNQMQQQGQRESQQMQRMAEQMARAAESMQQGEPPESSQAMQSLASQMEQMQQEMNEAQDLEEAMKTLNQSKQQMRCQSCGGAGCKDCNGQQGGQAKETQNGNRAGRRAGSQPTGGLTTADATPPAEPTESFETQVRGQVQRGKAVVGGLADGPNRKGISREDVRRAVEQAMGEESDPQESELLPKAEREHTTDYFRKLRGGE